MKHRCVCPCHAPMLGERQRCDGVDVREPIAAVTACVRCVNSHCPALVADERDIECEMGTSESPTRTTAQADGSSPPFLPPNPWAGEDGG